jgi:hypothetical protein
MASLLDRLRVPVNFCRQYGSLPEIRNPKGTEIIRLHPDWHFDGLPMVRPSTASYYVVDTPLYNHLIGRMVVCDLHAAITAEGVVFLWPVSKDIATANTAAAAAVREWVTVAWNQGSKAYKVEEATTKPADPTWPFESFDALIEVALKDRILADAEDPVVKALLERKKKKAK